MYFLDSVDAAVSVISRRRCLVVVPGSLNGATVSCLRWPEKDNIIKVTHCKSSLILPSMIILAYGET